MAPTSQKAGERPISFLLSGGTLGDISLSLVIRPEDLTRVEPARMTVEQTLGGAWVDDFGPGLATINISGHTGWSGRNRPAGQDGEYNFLNLRDTVWTTWHSARADAVKRGSNPDEIRLVFADSLDHITARVAPGQFVLKRNRARPLLMMYQISMTVLGDDVAPTATEKDGAAGDQTAAGLDSLSDSIDRISNAVGQVQKTFDSSIVAPVRAFLGKANAVMGKTLAALNAVDNAVIIGPTAQLVGFASDIAQAGRNAMYTYNAIASQPDLARMAVCDIASAFDNAFCVLSNVFRRYPLYPDYSDLYGASNCSSTAGGSPLSPWRTGNAFEQVVPQYTAPLAVTPLAQSHISALRATDPIQAPIAMTDLGGRLGGISTGVTVT